MMYRIGLHKDTPRAALEEMDLWLKERNGYIGEGEFYFVDPDEYDYTMRFYPVAFALTEEDAVVFKLTFGIGA